jgi:IS30 family transposase
MGSILKSYAIREKVIEYIKLGYSPPLISGIMKMRRKEKISHETIYQFIYHKDYEHLRLWEYLPSHRIKRKKHNGRSIKKTKIPNRICISERPEIIGTREEFGHWEADSVE